MQSHPRVLAAFHYFVPSFKTVVITDLRWFKDEEEFGKFISTRGVPKGWRLVESGLNSIEPGQ